MCLSLFCFYQVTNVKVRLPLLEQQNNLAAVLGKYTPVVMSSFLILERTIPMIIRAAPTAIRKDIVQASHWKGPVSGVC